MRTIPPPEAYEVDDERVAMLGQQITDTINDFQREHHDHKVTVSCSDREILMAVSVVLASALASVECRTCREQFGHDLRRDLGSIIRHAVANPIATDGGTPRTSHMH